MKLVKYFIVLLLFLFSAFFLFSKIKFVSRFFTDHVVYAYEPDDGGGGGGGGELSSGDGDGSEGTGGGHVQDNTPDGVYKGTAWSQPPGTVDGPQDCNCWVDPNNGDWWDKPPGDDDDDRDIDEGSSGDVDVPSPPGDVPSPPGDVPPVPEPLLCNISGPDAILSGQAGHYQNSPTSGNPNRSEVYWSPTGSQSWTNMCSGLGTGCTGSVTFSNPGTYYVVGNLYNDTDGTKCTSNPFGILAEWTDCGSSCRMTVTVTNPINWVKLKDASFSSPASLQNYLPGSTASCDADDDGTAMFIIGEAGVASANPLTPTTSLSVRGWKATPYAKQTNLPASSYIEYLKARKTYKTITKPSDVTGNGIYVWDKNTPFPKLSGVPPQLNNYNIVLVVQEAVTIGDPLDPSKTTFNPTKSFALFAPSITFSPYISQARGIFVADSIDAGTTTDRSLKITGNLIASTTFSHNRVAANTACPALFVVNKAGLYIDLLPYLSIDKYDWRQLQ